MQKNGRYFFVQKCYEWGHYARIKWHRKVDGVLQSEGVQYTRCTNHMNGEDLITNSCNCLGSQIWYAVWKSNNKILHSTCESINALVVKTGWKYKINPSARVTSNIEYWQKYITADKQFCAHFYRADQNWDGMMQLTTTLQNSRSVIGRR